MLEQADKDKKKERVRSMATAKEFTYDDAARRATYTGDAHLSGPQGDMTAAKHRAVSRSRRATSSNAPRRYDAKLTLREQSRKTTGIAPDLLRPPTSATS